MPLCYTVGEMKTSDRIKRDAEATMEKIRAIARHIRNVEDNCLLLGEKLIERGEVDLMFFMYFSSCGGLSLSNPSHHTLELRLCSC